jgi:hypothetical protein
VSNLQGHCTSRLLTMACDAELTVAVSRKSVGERSSGWRPALLCSALSLPIVHLLLPIGHRRSHSCCSRMVCLQGGRRGCGCQLRPAGRGAGSKDLLHHWRRRGLAGACARTRGFMSARQPAWPGLPAWTCAAAICNAAVHEYSWILRPGRLQLACPVLPPLTHPLTCCCYLPACRRLALPGRSLSPLPCPS